MLEALRGGGGGGLVRCLVHLDIVVIRYFEQGQVFPFFPGFIGSSRSTPNTSKYLFCRGKRHPHCCSPPLTVGDPKASWWWSEFRGI